MGYSILQLPIMFHFFLKNIEVWYHLLKSRVFPEKQHTFQIDVKENGSSVNDDPLKRSQIEKSVLDVKSSLSKLDERLEFFQERLLKLETKIEESLVLKLNK